MRAQKIIAADDLCPCGSGATYGTCCLQRGPDAYGNKIHKQTVPVLLDGARTEILSSFIGGDKRFRIIWNRLHSFPQEQTFHEFLDCKCQSKHTVDRLNLQPAVRSGQITAGLLVNRPESSITGIALVWPHLPSEKRHNQLLLAI